MADNSFALFPVAELLLALGARPGKTRNTFHSPFREDKNPSLHIDPRRNVWFDHGAGIGGGNIDLVMKCRDCSAREAVDFILSLSSSDPATQVSSGNEKTPGAGLIPEVKPLSSRIVTVRELRSPYLLDYAASRGIPEKIAVRYCKEVVLRGKTFGKTYDHIGFPNNNGGFALKSPSGFKSTTKSGITTIDSAGAFSEKPLAMTVTVFEGFFDFLSWLSSAKTEVPSTDVVVLNSVANIGRAIPYLWSHHTVVCCLDHDEAGRNALEALRSVRTVLRNPTIIDGSLFYFDYNDVNEWWMAMIRLLDK